MEISDIAIVGGVLDRLGASFILHEIYIISLFEQVGDLVQVIVTRVIQD